MKNIKKIIAILFFTILFIGCGGGDSSAIITSSSSNPSISSGISGSVQKGPFIQGSLVTAYKLNNGERSSTDKISTTTDDNKGNFSLTVTWDGATEYVVSGDYLDENTGNHLSGGLLSAIVNSEANITQKININIFTHIAASQIKEMLKNNRTIEEAKQESKDKLKEMFSLELDGDTQLEDLDLTDGMGAHKSDNTQLLKVSAAILSLNNPDTALEKLTKFINIDGGINEDVLNVYNNVLEKSDEVNLDDVHNILKSKIGVSNAPNGNTREGNLPFNHGLSFDTKMDVDINKGLVSNYIIINNLNGNAKLNIQNGFYSLNDADYVNVDTTVKNGDRIRVKHYSSSNYSSETNTILNIGLSKVLFKSITKSDPRVTDITPNKFLFPIKINIQPGVIVSSDEIVVSGLSDGISTSIGISSGASYQINNGTWKNNAYGDVLSPSSVINGDIIKVSNTSSNNNGGKSVATLTIGGVEGKFIVFSKEKDTRPDLFFPETIYEANVNTVYETPYFQTSGYEGGLDIEVTNGEVQLEGESTWLSRIPQVPIGYKVKFRQTSSSSYGTTNKTVIKFGKSIIYFETITKSDPAINSAVPNKIKFKTVFDANIDSFVESEERVITGMNGSATYAYVSEGDFISLNGGAWTDEPVNIGQGSKIRLRIKTGLGYNNENYASVYYGPEKKLFGTFLSYTLKKDSQIDDVDFLNKKDVKINTYYESDIVTITGINYAARAYIINGEFKINNGEWKTSNNGLFLHNNDTLQLRHKSAQEANQSVHTIVSFDTVHYEFITTTSNVPQLLNSIPKTIDQNSNYNFIPNVRDSHNLIFSLISKPSWMNINSSSGEISGIPTQSDIGQTDTISLVIKSSSGLEKSIDFKVTVNDVNDAPILSDTWSVESVDENRNYSRSATATDIERGVLTWSISNNPSWLSINSQTGKLTGVPRQADVGIKEDIKVTVTEEGGLSSSFTFKITVIDKNSDAQLLVISDKTVNENEELIVQAQARDLDGDILTFGIENKPAWMSFDTATGKLSGTPTELNIGVYANITISVTDGHGSTRFESFKITVLDVNEAPTITSSDFTKEFILDDTNSTLDNYTFVFNIDDSDNSLSSSNVTYRGVITETRVGYARTADFSNTTVECIRGRCVANISFAFQDIDDFHPSLKTRHIFTVSDGDKTASNYIDIWYAPTKPILSGETSHTIEPKDKTSYESFSFIPTNSGNKARTWSIKNKPAGFDFNTTTGELKYEPLAKGLLLNDTLFKGIEITASNDRGVSNKLILSILVKGKPSVSKFEFNDKIGVEIQQWFDSSITVDWLEDNQEVSISSSGYVGQSIYSGFKVNGQSGITTVKNGDIVTVWHKSSNEYNTTSNTIITIGEDSDTFSTTTKESVNTKLPLIVGAPNTSANVDELYTYTPQLSTDYTKFAPATKPFTIENKPSWATFNSTTGTLSGTPSEIGIHNQVRITAFGDNGLDDITFNITVSKDAPYISGYGHSLENADLSFTFTDNPIWRNNITEVSMYGCYDQSNLVVLNPNDYTFREGSLKLHSSTSTNVMLHVPFMGGAGLIVKSTDYPDSEAFIDMIEDGQYGVKAIISQENTKIKITLTNELKFTDNTLDISNFSIAQGPLGTFIKSVEYLDSENALLTLAHSGIKTDEVLNIKIAISPEELNICQSIESNSITISQLEEVSKNILKTGVTNTLINEDDAFYKKGQNRSYAYTDNIDYHKVNTNIVLDNTTGLQWQNNKLVTSDDYSSFPGEKNWNKANQYCENLSLDTYEDWRLPSIDELLTLVDYSKQDNMLDDMFNHLGSVVGYPEYYYYWSSTSYSTDSAFAWNIDLKTGEHHYHGKNSNDNVRCVRGETLNPSQYARSIDGVVKDFSTNLSWQDNEIYNSISIDDAITYCQNLTLGNNSNWRVPNVNELKSILNHNLSPLNISDVFQNTSTALYYSSTHNTIDNTKYWLVGFANDGTKGDRSQSNYKTRCVSGDNIAASPSVKLTILDGSDTDADNNHIKLGVELIGTTFSDENVLTIQLNRAPDKDISAMQGFVYVDETHVYIIENMENISEDITVSFTVHNTEIDYSENITSNSIVIKKP